MAVGGQAELYGIGLLYLGNDYDILMLESRQVMRYLGHCAGATGGSLEI
jgi:hypothetical protein